VDPATINQLNQINCQFYQTFASSFSRTRYAVQRGVKLAAERYFLPGKPVSLLDVGCGNGNLVRHLIHQGFKGVYTGLDFSTGLLDSCPPKPDNPEYAATFLTMDITQQGWESAFQGQSFDRIACFAVMHHIPSHALRVNIFQSIYELLTPGGIFIQSNWLFMNSSKLQGRILPWETVNLTDAEVEPGDFLLDWKAEIGHTGYRYVHLFDDDQLAEIAAITGFTIRDRYVSDGRDGNLALYHIWQTV